VARCESGYDPVAFSAGRDCGTRVGACIARAAALELLERGRWWSRWRYRLMARALVACAEELELDAEEEGRRRREGPQVARLASEDSGGRRGGACGP
jgi:hypothetical protein